MAHATEDVFSDHIFVESFEGRGNGVSARDDIPSDTTVATERPTACCLEPKWGSILCEGCLEPAETKACELCGIGARCLKCDKDSLPQHDNTECKAFQAAATIIDRKSAEDDSFNPLDMTLLVRTLFRLRRAIGPEEKGHAAWGLSRQVSSNEEKTVFRKNAAKIAAKITKTDKDSMWRLCHVVETNCYSVYRKEWYRPSGCSASMGGMLLGKPPPDADKPIGIAVYVALSFFNHSCAPNVTKIRRGVNVDIVSLRPIAKGEEVCHSYVPSQMSQGKRKDELEHNWGFLCQCPRCADASDMWAVDALCSCTGYLIRDPEDDSSAQCCQCGSWVDV